MNIIFIAPPAAGKGTQSTLLVDKYGYKHISTGSLLRNEALVNEKIKTLIDKGLFVSDETVIDVLKRNIGNENIILDGMPRNLNQALNLDSFFKDEKIDLEKVIFIDIDKHIAASRVENRLTCEKCKRVYNKEIYNSKVCMICGGNLISREDDTKEVFEKRYDTYLKETKPLIDYYKDKLIKIYNNDTLESLYDSLDKEMKK